MAHDSAVWKCLLLSDVDKHGPERVMGELLWEYWRRTIAKVNQVRQRLFPFCSAVRAFGEVRDCIELGVA